MGQSLRTTDTVWRRVRLGLLLPQLVSLPGLSALQLVAFFDHWAWRHDYNGSVVCVRTGGTVPKSAKEWTKRQVGFC